ncbi:restriction endonuclease subunit S [Staphylococcus ursi]|uniref:restriction endonuclease subunit S n=1 Tax=Staphylococcus sp. MI 10-1553 TaxID=1912064 RepID=UPI001398A762|nr:restriction endonuclease subunit S [Staphylococcus sp. MI 10-1553]QHW36002.1 restriction endonuclease subunit S [Staphylococcus sp. MI 10-1553]
MTNEPKNLPELRFPEFEKSWRIITLGEATTKIGSGKTPLGGSSVYLNNGIPFLRSQNIQYGILDLSELVYIDENTDENMKSSRTYYGDILLNITGASIGRSAVNTIKKGYANLNQHVCIIRLKEHYNYHFIGQFLISPKGQKKIFMAQSGGSREGLNFNEISKIKFSLPDELEEQQKTGDFFSKLDRQIELEEQKLALLEEQKKGYMQKIFSQELRFKDENEGDYPEWKIKKIEDIASVTKGFTPSTKNNDYWHDENRNWLSIAGMDEKYLYHGNKGITDLASQKHDKVDKNTLIMSFKLTLGKLGIVKEPMYTNEAICHFNWKSKNVNTEYVYYYLSYINISSFGSQAVKGITLNNDSINSIVIKLPSLSEQYKISDLLKKYDEFIEKQLAKIELLKERKKGFLQKMFV